MTINERILSKNTILLELPAGFIFHPFLSVTEYGEYVNILSMSVAGEPLTSTLPRPPASLRPLSPAHTGLPGCAPYECVLFWRGTHNTESEYPLFPVDRSPQILNSRLFDIRFAYAARLLTVMSPYE
ncbi:MAG: hypothetical protein LBL31_01380 [Spirochaetaceae bacterium]|jgi:hypothetical protein|nr:hypothetical protein [Spirochaetaceae bacterium]